VFVQPTVVGNYLYVGSCAGIFYSFDRLSGDIKWQYDVSTDGASQFHGNPIATDSIIIFGTDQARMEIGTIYALDRYSGDLVWKSEGHSGAPSDAVIHQDSLVYFITRDDSLLALSLHNGVTAWSFSTGWRRESYDGFETSIEIPAVTSSAVISGNNVYFAGRDSTVYCLHALSGELKWSRKFDAITTSDLSGTDSQLIIGLSDYQIVSIDAKTGAILRSDSVSHLVQGGMGESDGILTHLGGFEDERPTTVAARDVSSGKQLWTVALEDPDPQAYWYVPRMHNWGDQVIVGSTSGVVVSYNIQTGAKLWDYQFGGPIRGIGHSKTDLYVGTFDGIIYALAFNHAPSK
jgi:outer membrane protein assembly factor BamB